MKSLLNPKIKIFQIIQSKHKKIRDDSDTSIDEEIKSLSGPELSSKLIEERSKLVDHWQNQFEQMEQKMDRQKIG